MQTKILPAKYIMKTDDDAFVRIDQVLTSLKEKPSNGLLYGRISLDSSPHRDRDSKWYISNEASTPIPGWVAYWLYLFCCILIHLLPGLFFILFCWMSFFAGMATWCISTMGSWPRLHYITGYCKVHCPRPPGKRSQGKFLLKAEKCYCNIH